MRYRDRFEAGCQLGSLLADRGLRDPVILGLPRGGLPVAAEVAAALEAAYDVFVARKVGAPGHEELGIGAVAEGSDEIVVTAMVSELRIDDEELQVLADTARAELRRRVAAYRRGRALPLLADQDVVLVDDGLATGVTAEAALRSIRAARPRRLILAVPVGSRLAVERLTGLADEVVSGHTPERFVAVGKWYADFRQTSDEEVLRLLQQHHG